MPRSPHTDLGISAAIAGRGGRPRTGPGLARRPGGTLFPTVRDSDLVARIPRPRAIRAKVVCLLAVPIVSLMTLWGLAAVQTAQTVYALAQLKQLDAAVGTPNGELIGALQHERIDVARYLGGPPPGERSSGGGRPNAALTADYASTDTAAGALRSGTVVAAAATTWLGAQVGGPVSTLLGDLSELPALRGEVARRQVTWATAQAGYTKVIGDALALDSGLSATLSSVGRSGQAASESWAAAQLARSREMLARQAAIVAQARAQSPGATLAADSYRAFAGAYYSEHELEQSALAQLGDTGVAAYQRVTSSAPFQRLQGAQQTLLDAGDQGTNSAAIAQAQGVWSALAPGELDRLGDVIAGTGTAAIAQVNPYSQAFESKAGAGVLLGLFAVTASLLVSVWIGRGLVLELVGLRDSALDLARRRLPGAIARLRAGQEVDLEAEVGRGALGISKLTGAESGSGDEAGSEYAADCAAGADEVGQVAMALASVHRAALRAALDRAEAVNGVAGVFLNLARRSQVLLHRQLALLDLMERRIEDPAELEDLFRLDHLATRMRRHAEGLIILSGAAPGRGWRRPVLLMDVVRAAVAEVEDFARVDVRQMPDARVAGAAVADLTHLLAELVENATSFSPPHTRVQVLGAHVAAGYALEIEDRGLGMGAATLAEANRRIDSDRPDDLLDSDRLGLFVVSRLARRHGVRVALRHSAYGGTKAVVLLPKALLGEPEPAAGAQPAAIGARQGPDFALAGTPSRGIPVPARTGAPTGYGSAAAGPAARSATAIPAWEPAASTITDSDADHATLLAPAALRASAGPETPGGLPRRVKQASLAPGLRADPRTPTPAADADEDPPPRTPEQARAFLSAYQQGWSRGRGTAGSAGAPPFSDGDSQTAESRSPAAPRTNDDHGG